MFPLPAGWTAGRAGPSLTLHLDEDPGAGVIRCVEGLAPLRPAADVIRALPPPRAFVPTRYGAIERFVTDEGEHGAFAVVEGACGQAPVELTFAVVYGDERYTRIVGAARVAHRFAVYRETVRRIGATERLLLGAPRRRRFVYAPPPGWQGVAHQLEATWLAPGYPDDCTAIAVAPALPSTPEHRASTISLLLGPGPIEPHGPAEAIETSRGLPGERRRWRVGTGAGAALADLVVLDDGMYVYGLRLSTPAAPGGAANDAFERVIASVERLPIASPAAARTALEHWSH